MLKCGNKAVIGDGCVKDKICLRISPGKGCREGENRYL